MSCQIWHSLLELLNLQAKATMFLTEIKITADKDNRRFFARRSYNLYSDVQKGENVVVEIPVQAGEKKFKYEQKVKLVNPKLYGRGYAIGDMGHTDYVLVADDIVAVEEK